MSTVIVNTDKLRSDLGELNAHLADKPYIGGFQLSADDQVVYTELSATPHNYFPHALRWYRHIASFSEDKQRQVTAHSAHTSESADNSCAASSRSAPVKNQAHGETRTWHKPAGPEGPLKLYNSLTKEKNEFVPISGKEVKWYMCGPTVYDASHMGHARSYISVDILRRVLVDYFNYDVLYVMNITDIDDKIINRARRNHLIKLYKEASHPNEKIIADVEESIAAFQVKLNETVDEDKKKMLTKILDSSTTQLVATKAAPSADNIASLLTLANDPLSDVLDKQFGASLTDHSIFAALTQHWEKDFNEDMKELNILPADVLTRVSQYVPEIVTYIQQIIENGFAYESNGSVYFDTLKFASSGNYEYAKLVPEAVGNLSALAEGEGDLTTSSGEKRSDRDFALWKAGKSGEPIWPSPWGQGRPGWHIECSVMASDVLGKNIDIHTGGVDLKFPHHDNELAQAEAHYCNQQWINYFLHAGHLTIEGCKMSKSLKNFVSIKDALQRNTARQIRLMFLLHSWTNTLDYSQNALKEACTVEKNFADFFLNVKDALRKPENCPVNAHNYRDEEKQLQENFVKKKSQVNEALCDSVDTASAMQHMQSLIKLTNIYMGAKKTAESTPNHAIIGNIAKYLTKMLKIFGANGGDQLIGFPSGGASGASNHEETVMPFVNAIAEFREDVRTIAREEKVRRILDLCDDVRDNRLIDIGVRLEDQEAGGLPVVKLVDRDILIKERDQKLAEIEKKKKEKEDAKRKQLEEKAAKEAKAKIPPSELFRNETDKYSQFDDQGMPTHDAAGEALSSSLSKKLKKMFISQEKTHKKWLLEQNNP